MWVGADRRMRVIGHQPREALPPGLEHIVCCVCSPARMALRRRCLPATAAAASLYPMLRCLSATLPPPLLPPPLQAFVESMRKRGVSFLEMLAMEMKAEAKYVARGLSFK